MLLDVEQGYFLSFHMLRCVPFLPSIYSDGDRPNQNEKRKEKNVKRGGGSRFEPYASPSKRYRAFITNIPFDVKWQYLKDLVKEKGNWWSVCLRRASVCCPCPVTDLVCFIFFSRPDKREGV